VNDYGTSRLGHEQLEKIVRATWSLKPARILKDFDLLKPIYSQTASYGHFGRDSSRGKIG